MKLPPQDWQPPTLLDWQQEFNERAAIIEFDGGFTRAQAQQMAGMVVGEWKGKP